ncbi:polyol transporter 5-like isoform X2 [Benincasa hispida]|uniref:polyol transporter 5-like isoform X2 n=1 Tax=Benincasa hispida TaxID=102211 RepID=UPI00190169B3|nr:polyol transporter 5-like isoform X2 [Benincasa hispida]
MADRKDEMSSISGHSGLPPTINPKQNKYAFVCATMTSMASVLLGYDVGVMSGAVIFIQKDFGISDVKVEILLGIISLYSMVGAVVAGRTSDWIGRRYTMGLAAAFFFLGAVLMGLATDYSFLMFGRFFAGVGIGFAGLIASIYTAEISPAASRGCFTSFPELFINFGILLGYVSNFAFSKLPTHLSWRFMLGIGVIPSAILVIIVLIVPESPSWLVMKGRIAEAKRVLEKTSVSIEESQQRLADIKIAIGIPPNFCGTDDVDAAISVSNQSTRRENVWKELFLHPTPSVRHILIAAIGLHFFQQASGNDGVVLYSPRIFEKAGITSSDHKLLATVAVGIIKTTFILVATFLLDRIGRRPLILISVAGQTFSLAILGFSLTIINNSHVKVTWAIILCITMLLCDVSFFSLGLGPMTSVYTSEIFPLRLRASGVSLAIIVNRVTSGVVTMTFLSLYHALTIGGAFFLYAGIAAVGWLFFFVVFPETRGHNLEDVEGLFGNFLWSLKKNKGRAMEVELEG